MDHSISNYDDVYDLSETLIANPKYNVVEVSSEPISDTVTLSISEVPDARSGTFTVIEVYAYPFQTSIDLQHSYDNTVNITPNVDNPIQEQLIEEVIEFVDGSASIAHPIVSIDSFIWQKVDLGVLSFDGTNISSEIKANSLCKIVYTTEYHLFDISVVDLTKVQLFITD